MNLTYNAVLTIPKDRIKDVEGYLIEYKKDINNEHMILSAKKNNITFNFFKSGKLVLQGTNKQLIDKEKKTIMDKLFKEDEDLILGFDEVGRSEIEGPFVISSVLGYNKNLLELRDSKKTSKIEKSKKVADEGSLASVTLSLNPKIIDMIRGDDVTLNTIETEYIKAIKGVFTNLGLDFRTIVDGQALNNKLRGIEYTVKADDTVPVVASASIIAKSTRDHSFNKDERKSWKVKNQ